MKYCSILGPPRPNLEKGAGTRLPAAFSRKLGPVLERQLTSKPRRPLPPVLQGKKPENQWKSKLRSKRDFSASERDSKRYRFQNGPKREPKWSQNGAKMAPKRVSDWVIDFEPVFGTIFQWFWTCFEMIFLCCFRSSHHVHEKRECSESPHFYSGF